MGIHFSAQIFLASPASGWSSTPCSPRGPSSTGRSYAARPARLVPLSVCRDGPRSHCRTLRLATDLPVAPPAQAAVESTRALRHLTIVPTPRGAAVSRRIWRRPAAVHAGRRPGFGRLSDPAVPAILFVLAARRLCERLIQFFQSLGPRCKVIDHPAVR